MKAVVQRVSSASVAVDDREVARIGRGFLVLLGVAKGDAREDAEFVARKIAGLRVFNDGAGRMNLAVLDPSVGGEILAVSQFTLLAEVRKGNRPSFVAAEEPERAQSLFDRFVEALRARAVPVRTGVFGAAMRVSLVNDGPVTILIESGS